jgi:chromatin segregation and condensation protein Rec8/ScpA/Scc1 (kleisin family)
MNKTDSEKGIAEIDALPAEKLTSEDIKTMEENGDEVYTQEDVDQLRKYNGILSVRIPKELHRILVIHAKENGTSLNQYVMYCLTKTNAPYDTNATSTPRETS